MSQQELLSKVIRALDETGCAYMLTGSFASSMQGEPRLSHDIDLVVDLRPQALPELLRMFLV
jgi:predicted nucleotidyltransferase